MRTITLMGFVVGIALSGCNFASKEELRGIQAHSVAMEARLVEAENRIEQLRIDRLADLESAKPAEVQPAKAGGKGPRLSAVSEARMRADRVVCLNNLKELGKLAILYSDDHKSLFPKARGKSPPSYQSLQLLVDEFRGLKPELFVCAASANTPAEVDENGRFTLDEKSTSYAWIGQRMKSTAPPKWALGACLNHLDEGGINVVHVGMNVEWVPADEIPARLVDTAGRPLSQGR